MPKHFDYIITGGGLAGLQLALNMGRERFFEQRTVAIIDPSTKSTNDKTWCFWEKGTGKWDKIITKSWNTAYFITSEVHLKLDLTPYSYKMLRSLDFYSYAKQQLKDCSNISFIQDEIREIDSASTIAYGKLDSYSGLHIFDSRITSNYREDDTSTTIFQHFKGWLIETEDPAFDDSAITMMDYRLKFKNSTSFTYVLPVSATKALVEFTFFTPFLTDDSVYEEYLTKYIKDILKLNNYKITGTEKGIVPMTDFPFHRESSEKITKIGTGGSWVKGSTGYSFKHSEKKAEQIIKNIKNGKEPAEGIINDRARFYDAIFLDVLYRHNEKGEEIFTKFYSKNSPSRFFKYLDEETSLKEDIQIMFSLYDPEFIRSLFRKI